MSGQAAEATQSVGRAYCYRCMRVAAMCLCADLDACDNRTEVHVLQHRKERKHAFNTVRLLKLGLQNIRVHDLHTDMGQSYPVPKGFPLDAGVLYPGPGSLDLSELSPDERPKKLVVIDGTWSQAHRMYRDNQWLRGLVRYRLQPSEPSRYRIRKEPRAECLSTLESTVMALSLIEPETPGIDSILRAFDLMNDRQVAQMQANRGGPKRFKHERPRPMRAVPAPIWSEPNRIVVVYAESALPLLYRDGSVRELAQWTAVRLTEPTCYFDRIVATEGPMPSGCFLEDLAWSQSDLDRAQPLREVRGQWMDFVRPGDVIVAWNAGTLRLARHHHMASDGIVLKSVYGNTTQRNFGTLDDVIAHDGLQAVARPPVAGRARSRLAHAHTATLELGRWARHRQGLC
jgi:DTW domain-containing protein YfiP